MFDIAQYTVCIVDDDESIRQSLLFLMKAEGIPAIAYQSALEFLDEESEVTVGVLIVDVRMPGMTGPELQEQLHSRNKNFPVIFITGHGDLPMAVNAMKNGAMDFIEKPFSNDRLLESVKRCLTLQQRGLTQVHDIEDQNLIMKLTPREHEVIVQLATGKSNKEIARVLEISPRTVEVHRSNIMEKMQANNLADLVRMALRILPELC